MICYICGKGEFIEKDNDYMCNYCGWIREKGNENIEIRKSKLKKSIEAAKNIKNKGGVKFFDKLEQIKNKDWHLYVGYYDHEPNEKDVKWMIETIEQLKDFIEY
jgi:biotin synthase-like enzyme